MRARLLKQWDRLRASFWFLPAIMAVAAALLASSAVSLDERAEDHAWMQWEWLYGGGAEGASAVLQTIAGSMITIAGVVFSMTLVALTLASAQFGPRLLRNFMSDKSNQLVLGTFIATFIYCLLVMRTVRREDEAAFVPHFSVTLAVVFALVSMAVLIYFIHHVSVSIQADEVVARVAKELDAGVDRLFPEQIGTPPSPLREEEQAQFAQALSQKSRLVAARQDGYLQFIDAEALMDLAAEHDLVMRIEQRPGQYATRGNPLVLVAPANRATTEVVDSIAGSLMTGNQRTPAQDVEFGFSQLAEIAVRALSPGVNDPFTAMRCLDRLGSALYRLAQRTGPSPYRRDKHDRLRIWAPPVTFALIMDASLDPVRQYAASSAAVTVKMLEVLGLIARAVTRADDMQAIRRQARLIGDGASRSLAEASDRATVQERLEALRATLDAREGYSACRTPI